MIAKIISGGQTGVDIATLRAAKRLGIPTGGTMPRGFRTLAGPKPEWAEEFGLVEHTSDAYPPRTWRNVKNSDITVRIALDFNSPGELCTAAAISSFRKPAFSVPLRRRKGELLMVDEGHIGLVVQHFAALKRHFSRDITINFTGNSERTAPGIEVFAEVVVHQIIEATRV